MYGQKSVRPSSEAGWTFLRHFDAFPKQREEAKEFFQSTVAGGIITIVAASLMAILFLSELGALEQAVDGLRLDTHCPSWLRDRPR